MLVILEFCPPHAFPGFPMPLFVWTKLSLLTLMSGSLTLGVCFHVSGNSLDFGNLAPRLYPKKGHKATVTRIKLPVWSALYFTGVHGCHISSLSLRTLTRITRRHSWFKIFFLWQIPSPQAKSKRERGSHQGHLLNSGRYQQTLLPKQPLPDESPLTLWPKSFLIIE